MSTEQTPPEAGRALKIADQAYEIALAVEIDSQEMFAFAGTELQTIKARAKEIEELRFSLTRPLDLAKSRIMDLFRKPSERLAEAEALLKKSMVTFQQAEAAKAAEIKRQAEEAARKEREEQQRIQREAEAEQARIRNEAAAAQRKAEEAAAAARKAGDEAAARAAEEAAAADKARADAEAQAAAQRAEDAREAIELAEIAPISAPAIALPKAAGVSTRQNWKAELVSIEQLVRGAVAALDRGDTTLLGYLQADMVALNKVAKALKNQTRISGVRIYAEGSLAVRAA